MNWFIENRIQIIALLLAVLFCIIVINLVVKRKLRIEYTVVWFILSLFLIVFAIWREGIDILGKIFGVYAAPNLIFTGLIFFIFLYLLHLSVRNSSQHDKIKKQRIALLEKELRDTKDKT